MNNGVAVVVGAGPGLGAALVRRFAAGGMTVAVARRRAEDAAALAAEVGGIGANEKQPGRFFYANMAMGLHARGVLEKHGVELIGANVEAITTPKAEPKTSSR